MPFFEQSLFGNSVQTWTLAVAIAAGSMAVLVLARKLLVVRVGALARHTSTVLDDRVVELIAQIRWFSLAAVSLFLGSLVIRLTPAMETVMRKGVILMILLQALVWGSNLIKSWLDGTLRQRVSEGGTGAGSAAMIGLAARLVLWTVTLLLALDNLGFNITALVAGLGIGGIAIALAMQNILADIFASLSIMLDKPFEPGDFIVVDDHMGSIEHIGIKTTRIRSLSGEQIIFANGELLKSRIRNFKRMAERRVAFTISVTYDTTEELLRAIGPSVRAIIQRQAHTRLDRVHFKEYGDSALIYEAVYFVLSPDCNLYMDVQEAINFEILTAFRRLHIEFAFPTVTIVQPDENRTGDGAPMGQTEHQVAHR